MNRSEFLVFISNLNDIWPKSYENSKKNEYLFNVVKYYDYSQILSVFDRLVSDNHHAPSISKISEAIQIVIGSDRILREKQEFIDEVSSGKHWCKFCGATGVVTILDEEADNKSSPKNFALRCAECTAANRLRLSKNMKEFFLLTINPRYKAVLFAENSPYKANPQNPR